MKQIDLMIMESWAKTNEEIEAMMDNEYKKLQDSSTTRDRRKHYDNMVALYNEYDFLHILWEHIENSYKIIKRFIKKIAEKVKEIKQKTIDYMNEEGYYTYIIEYFNEKNEFVWLKVGKTKQSIKKRIQQHKQYYKDHADTDLTAKVMRVFSFDSETQCEKMEDKLRNFYRNIKQSVFVPKDRFLMIRYNEKELEDFLSTV